MNRQWLAGLVVGAAVAAATLVATRTLDAQSKATTSSGKVAVLDVVQVFNDYQRQKDLTEEMNEVQGKLQEENTQRRQRIDALQAEIDRLDKEDPTFVQRARDLLAMQIEYKNWVDLKQADLTREVGVWTNRVYREICRAAEAIAKQQGYDLVLYKGKFDDNILEPDQAKEQIRNMQVIFAGGQIELTQAVADKLNADYRAQPRVKMMLMP